MDIGIRLKPSEVSPSQEKQALRLLNGTHVSGLRARREDRTKDRFKLRLQQGGGVAMKYDGGRTGLVKRTGFMRLKVVYACDARTILVKRMTRLIERICPRTLHLKTNGPGRPLCRVLGLRRVGSAFILKVMTSPSGAACRFLLSLGQRSRTRTPGMRSRGMRVLGIVSYRRRYGSLQLYNAKNKEKISRLGDESIERKSILFP
ncbi:hypothetical protein BJ912DRAFT_592216 [Pholiota molesta]|nr:hypothetical protein BJ912DRAFT_592216 [Pholiota molesta]